MSRGSRQTLFSKKKKKYSRIINHERNANQIQNELPPPNCQNDCYKKKQEITNFLEDEEKRCERKLAHPLWKTVSVQFSSVQSVTQSCPTLCNRMNCSMPGLPVHHQIPEFTQTHVHRVSDAIQTSHPVVPFSSCLQSLPASGFFPMSQLFAGSGQSIDVSASASVLPMNSQD